MSGHTKISAMVLALALAPVTGAAQATQSAAKPAGPTKIGIVAIQQAIAASNEGKKDLEALQQKFAPKQAELKNQNDEVENLKKQLQAKGETLSEEARATQARALETKQKSLQRNFEDAQTAYQQEQQEIFNRIGTKMVKVLEAYAVKNGYGVILDVSNPQTPVLYASEATNITKEIVDAYNAQSPAAASKPAATQTKPAPAAAAAKTGTSATKHP